MPSGGVLSLNHDVTTSFHLHRTSIYLKSPPLHGCIGLRVHPYASSPHTKVLNKNKMLTESKRVKNCEKQRVHHQKQIVFPTKKRKKTNEIDINQNEWSLRFLFGKHCDILFPNKTLFSIEETFAY